MKLIALGDYVLLEKLSHGERKVGAVFTPQSQQSLMAKGRVLTVGKGRKISLLELQPGDIVYYNEIANNSYASSDPALGDIQVWPIRHDFIMMRENRENE